LSLQRSGQIYMKTLRAADSLTPVKSIYSRTKDGSSSDAAKSKGILTIKICN